ncbi:MAG: ABC transporter substrate-binding protein [Acidobacteriota bacterium]
MSRPSLCLQSALLALATSLLLFSCTHYTNERDVKILSVSMAPDEVAIWREISKEFERTNPDVRINVTEAPQASDARETLYTTSLLAGEPTHDLLYLDIVWTPKFAAAGWLLEINDLLSAAEWQDYLPGGLSASTYRDHIYRLPIRSDTGLLYYRKDLLAEAGLAPPETFSQMIEIARRLQAPPRLWGYVWQGKQYEGLVCNFLEVLVGMGGYWIDSHTGNVGLDGPEAHAALNFLHDAVLVHQISPPGVTTYQEEEGRRLFQQGGAIFHRNWPYAWKLFQSEDSPVKGRVGVQPMVHAYGAHSAATQGGWGLAISRFSRYPEEARRFLRYTAQAEVQKRLILAKGFVPSRHSLFHDEEILETFPLYRDLYTIEQAGVPRPPVPQYAVVSDILQRYVSAAISDRLTVNEALKQATRETTKILR